jgi:hypothetical protein
MERAPLAGNVPGLLPVGDGLYGEPGLRIMMRHQLGLGFSGLGKALHQHLGNPLVVPLPGTLE